MRIMVVDDHQMTRQGLCSLIRGSGTLNLVAEAENGRSAIHKVDRFRPDVVVMDLAMPDMNGIEATRLMRRDYPDIKILALSMHKDKEYVRQALAAGASGYVLKDCAFEELVKALDTVNGGRRYLSPPVADVVVDEYLHQPHVANDKIYTDLSAREREILQLIAEGYPTRTIAEKLFVSVKTIETHRRNIQLTLGINNIAELTKYAVRAGLTSLEQGK
ncbi:MAG: response regulator [Lentisphaeria bacterium]